MAHSHDIEIGTDALAALLAPFVGIQLRRECPKKTVDVWVCRHGRINADIRKIGNDTVDFHWNGFLERIALADITKVRICDVDDEGFWQEQGGTTYEVRAAAPAQFPEEKRIAA